MSLAGTPALVRLALRRERRVAPWWVLLLVTMALVMVAYIDRNMGTPELKATYTELINRNAFFRALGGGTVEPDLGVLSSWRSGGFLYVMNGLAALMSVVRHTRADENAGRVELLRSGPVGRVAPLTAALLVAGGVALAGGALTTLALVVIGLQVPGSVAYGAAVIAAGWVFGAVAAVAAQLARSARTARVLALSALGVAYLMRYAGDATGQRWMVYLSPIGWSHLVEPYRTDRWWMLLIPLAVAAVLSAIAYRLAGNRDLGAGLIPEARGPANAPRLRGPISLSWRLHRGLLGKWAVGIAAFAAAAGGLGTIAKQLTAAPGASHLVESFGGRPGAPLDSYLWPIVLIFAHVIAVYPVLMVQRLRAEEAGGRAEMVQATPLTRLRWVAGHLLLTALGTAALLAVAGLVLGFVFTVLVGDLPTDLPRVLAGTLGTVPAAWLVGAICVFAYGVAPKASGAIAWATWVATAALGRIAGPLYGMWGGTWFEPFHYIPNTVGGAPADARPALVMLAVTALLVGGGLLALRRRDVVGGA